MDIPEVHRYAVSVMTTAPPSAFTRQSPKELIILVAERLWGDRGIDGVSLRQISTAAGFSTPVSVQYHFGDRDGLIRAIFEHRLPSIEARRSQLLHRARQYDADVGLKALLHIMVEPIFHQKDDRGIHSFAAFMIQAQKSSAAYDIRSRIRMPVTDEILDRILNSTPEVPPHLINYRLNFLQFAMLEQIIQAPHLENYSGFSSHQCYYNDMVNSVVSALTHPPDGEGLEFLALQHEPAADDLQLMPTRAEAGSRGGFL